MHISPYTLQKIKSIGGDHEPSPLRLRIALMAENLMQGPGEIDATGLENFEQAVDVSPLVIATSHKTDQDPLLVGNVAARLCKVGFGVMSPNLEDPNRYAYAIAGIHPVSIPWEINSRGGKSPMPFDSAYYEKMINELKTSEDAMIVAAYNPLQHVRQRRPGQLVPHLYLSGASVLPTSVTLRNPKTGRNDYEGTLPVSEHTDARVHFSKLMTPTDDEVAEYGAADRKNQLYLRKKIGNQIFDILNS